MYASSSCDNGSTRIDAQLYRAATDGNFEMFKNYEQPLDRPILGKNQNTILHVHLNSPRERSKAFAEKVLGQCPLLLWRTNNDDAIPLHIAAKYGHLDIVKVFIEEAKKPFHRDLETGEEEAVRRMLRITNKQKETALHLAIRGEFPDVAVEILKHEDPNFIYTANISGESPLYLAVDINDPCNDIALKILNKFESPDYGGPNGRTVFHGAAFYTYVSKRFLDLLFSKLGSFVNQADDSGWTPLHYAAYVNNIRVVRQILGTDKRSAYAIDKDRCRTALHMASCRGNVEIMEEIIDKCPECCDITDVKGWNVLHYAVISKSKEAVTAILKDSSLLYLLTERDIKGYTPFHLHRVSEDNSTIFSWMRNVKSDMALNFWNDELNSMFKPSYSLDDRERHEEEILEWMKDLGRGPLGSKVEVRKYNFEEMEYEFEEKVIPKLEKAKESHVVAAALVATVTFAAAFTLPGGYVSDDKYPNLKGTPILSRNAAFKAFVVTDAIAMVLSVSSVFIHFIMVMLGYKHRYYWLIRSAFWFLLLSMGAMVIAFVTGTYAVLAPSKGLAIAACVIGLTFFLHVAYASIRLIFNFIKRDKVKNRSSSTKRSLVRLLASAPRYVCF